MQFGVVKIAFLLALPCVAFQVFAAVDLTSVNHVQTGPKANSYVYLLGQNMSFVCSSTVRVIWTIPAVGASGAGALSLNDDNPRVVSTDANNDVLPSNITILDAVLGDSNTTVTCQEGPVPLNEFQDVVTIFVEGAPECPVPTLTSTTDSSLSISWVPPPTLLAVQYYLLDVTPAVDSVNGTQNISSTSFTVTGLQPSTEYTISVDACTEAGCSSGCMQLFTTGPFWEDSFVSVCSSSGAEPTITVFVQYSDNGVNITAGGFRVSIEGTSYSTNASVTGSGDYQASIGGLTAGADYTVRVQPFATILGGNVISRSISVSSVVSVTRDDGNYTASCVDTCVGLLNVSSCLTTVTCGSSAVQSNSQPGYSVEQIAGVECVTCTAYTVASLTGQLNFSQSDTGLRLGDACDDDNSSGMSTFVLPSTLLLALIALFQLKILAWF